MSRRKKLIVAAGIILIVVIAVVIATTRKKQEKFAETYGYFNSIWFTEKGAFAFENAYLDYYSPSSGKKVLICNKTGCSHDSECPARFDTGTVCGITYDDDGLLYLSDEECSRFDEKILYHADVDGTNRKKLHTFSGIQMCNNIYYADRYMFICYQNLLDKEGNDLEKPEAGIIVYDFKEEKEQVLFKESKVNAYIGNCSLYQSNVYFSYLYSDLSAEEVLEHAEDEDYTEKHYHTEVCSVPLAGGNTETVIEGIAFTAYVPVLNGKLVYSTSEAAYLYDLQDRKQIQLLEEACDIIPVLPEKEKVILRPNNQGAVEGKRTYYDIDVSKGSINKIETGDLILQAVAGDTAYYMDIEGNEGYCTKEGFYQGKAKSMQYFEDVVQKQLGK